MTEEMQSGATLCARPPLWKDAQEENTAPGVPEP